MKGGIPPGQNLASVVKFSPPMERCEIPGTAINLTMFFRKENIGRNIDREAKKMSTWWG